MALALYKYSEYFKPSLKIIIWPKCVYANIRTLSCTAPFFSRSTTETDPDKPIVFSKSDAARWKAQVSRSGGAESAPWFQPYVISLSLTIFMFYFFFLREESDIDLEFNENLYQRIGGLEEKQLEIVLEYNKSQNLPTTDIEKRLSEVRSGE